MSRFLRYTFVLCTLAWPIASSISCSNDKFEGPTLVSDTINKVRTFKIDTNQTAKLYTHFKDPSTLSFSWYVDGVKTDVTEPTYTFKSKESGSYIVTEEVKNDIATVTIDYYVLVRGKFDNGTFLFTNSNTGGFLDFLKKDTTELVENVFSTINSPATLGSNVSFATMIYGKLYIISKDEGLIVANAITLKKITQLKDIPANPNCLLGINRSQALLSTDNGVYTINLNPLSVGSKIPNLSGRVGNLIYGSKYIFALTLDKGLVAIEQNTLKVYRALNVGRSGLTQDLNGNIWTSYLDTLYQVSQTLSVKKYLLPQGFRVYSSWNPWNEGSLCLSKENNALFYVSSKADGSPSGNIIKISINTMSSYVTNIYKPMALEVFKTLDSDRVFSNIGLRISLRNNITLVSVNSDGSKPQLVVMKSTDGTLVKKYDLKNGDPTSILFIKAE